MNTTIINRAKKVVKGFLPFYLFTLLPLATSCAEEFDTSYQMEKPAEVAAAEQLNSYGTLLQYIDPSFHLGNTLTVATLQSEGTATTLTMENFNELTLSDAFRHSSLVAADGSVDTTAINSLADYVSEKNINIFCPALCSSTDVNASRLNSLIAPKLVVLEEQAGSDVWDFEGDELGTTYDVKKATGDIKGNAVIEEDPDGQSGKVLHVTKTNQSFPSITLNFPDGRTLGDYKKIRLDFKANNKTAVNQGIVFIMAGKNTELKKASEYGCVQGQWGRGLIEFNLEAMSFSEQQQAMTSVDLLIGPKLMNCDYLIDNITLEYTYQPSYYEEKTAEEKRQIITEEMEKYVAAVVGQRSIFSVWTIADNPVTSESSNIWKTNIGDTYFAPAAKAARQANSSIKLFVSEEQLTDADICKALVNVVEQAEKEGAKIDGIEAKVAVDEESDLTTMLETLAQTGKQIRLTFLAISAADDATAARILSSAVSLYKQKVPPTQRYGISFTAVNESSTNAGLWTSGYNRKQTYAGLADALQK